MDILVKIIQFFLCFTILIGIHEMGHFIMARVFKIRVEKFYIFFDPWFSLFKFKRGNTEYGLGWLPLGGYVKIAGMIDESMDTEQMKQPVKQDEFRAKPAWQRFLVMIAGVVMNVVLAVAIYIGICYTWGDTYFSNADAKWGYNFNEAGHKLGFHDGDRLVSIDGEEADDINKVVNSLIITESDRSVVVERNGRQVELILPLDELISMRQQKGYENFLPAPHPLSDRQRRKPDRRTVAEGRRDRSHRQRFGSRLCGLRPIPEGARRRFGAADSPAGRGHAL